MMDVKKLSNEEINESREEAEAFLTAAGLEKKTVLRLTLALEEVLLDYQEALGAEGSYRLRLYRRLGRTRMELVVPGPSLNPTAETGEESNVLRGILVNLGAAPAWQYRNGENRLAFDAPRKQVSQLAQLLLAMVAAVVLGFVSRLLPGGAVEALYSGLMQPLFDAFMRLLSAVSGPMILLSVAWGVYSIGDTATLNSVGKKMVGHFLAAMVVLTGLAVTLCLPALPLTTGGGGGSFSAGGVIQMLLDVVPGNIIAPLSEGNAMQIIFVAVVLGISVLVLDSKAPVLAAAMEQSNLLIQLVMEYVSRFIPVFVFLSLFNLFLSGGLRDLLASTKTVLLLVLAHGVVLVLPVIWLAIRWRVKPGLLLRKLLPTFLIGLTTASSSAAFSTNMETCVGQLGLRRSFAGFGVPLGQVLYMPAASVLFTVMALCMAEQYDVTLTPTLIINAMLVSVGLAVAVPPVPGGDFSCFALLFAQMGIPAEAIALAVAIDMLMDFISTATDLTCLQVELVEVSGNLNLLDTDRLHREPGRQKVHG